MRGCLKFKPASAAPAPRCQWALLSLPIWTFWKQNWLLILHFIIFQTMTENLQEIPARPHNIICCTNYSKLIFSNCTDSDSHLNNCRGGERARRGESQYVKPVSRATDLRNQWGPETHSCPSLIQQQAATRSPVPWPPLCLVSELHGVTFWWVLCFFFFF